MERKIYHIFDIDGTITIPRKPMDDDFKPVFKSFCEKNNVILVTGSNKELALEQIPSDILDLVQLYTCSGVEGLQHINVDYEIIDQGIIEYLEKILSMSKYTHRTGNHINLRKGMINFSVVGRNASDEDRKHYNDYDKSTKERERIVKQLKDMFWGYDFCIGGEISIDITKKGINKSLVAKDIFANANNLDSYLIFYGNQILDGNDYFLAKYIQDNNLGHSIQIEYDNLKKILTSDGIRI